MAIQYLEGGIVPLEMVSSPTGAIRVIRSEAELERERALCGLWPGHRDADLDFYLAILRSRPDVLSPYVLILYRDGKPQTMLMGRIEHTRLDFRVGYLSLLRPRVRMLSVIPWGLKGDASAENTNALITELCANLRAGDFDLAVLSFVDAASPLCELARTIPGFLSRDSSQPTNAHWKMDLAGDIKEIYRRLSSDHRGQLRRKVKKLGAEFGDKVEVRCLRDPADVRFVLQDVEEVARKTYQRGLGVGFSAVDEVKGRLQLQAEKGWLRAHILYIEGKPCAYWVGSLYEGVFYSDYLGHDPAYDKHSVGTFLTIKTIEELCREGAREIDFGPGESRYKQQFGTCKTDETHVYIFAPTFKGVALKVGRAISGRIDRTVRLTLERTKLLQRVKKHWRTRAAQQGSAE